MSCSSRSDSGSGRACSWAADRSAGRGHPRGRSRTCARVISTTGASGRAIPLRYAERTGERVGASPPRTAERIFALAEAGDEAAIAVVADVTEALAELVIDVAALLDPQVIVLGGGIARGQPSLVKEVSERVGAALPFPPRVAASRLGEDAVALGAASLALTLGQRRLAGVAPEPGTLGALAFA